MRAKELMLNDLVLLDYRVCKIVATNAYRDCVELIDISDEDNEVIGKYAKHISPIILTTEILKLNGFELEPSGCVWRDTTYELDRVYVEVSFRHDKSVRRIEICNNIRTSYTSDFDCLYVHTFQHILRVCGLDELADNFKVK